jgi:hypothetical protein
MKKKSIKNLKFVEKNEFYLIFLFLMFFIKSSLSMGSIMTPSLVFTLGAISLRNLKSGFHVRPMGLPIFSSNSATLSNRLGSSLI